LDEDYTDLYMRITITLLEQKIFERKPLIDELLEKEKNSVNEYYKSKASKKLKNKEDQEEDIQIKMREYHLELIEKIFQFYNGIKDNLNKLDLEVVGDTSINLLAEFYLMLKSTDVNDFVAFKNIVLKFGWIFLIFFVVVVANPDHD